MVVSGLRTRSTLHEVPTRSPYTKESHITNLGRHFHIDILFQSPYNKLAPNKSHLDAKGVAVDVGIKGDFSIIE